MLMNAPAIANLWTADVERAKLFYTEKLGLRSIDMPFDEIIALEAGEGTKFTVQKGDVRPSEHTVLVFSVKDVAATVADLSGRGVKMESYDVDDLKTDERGVADMGGFYCAWFKDPDGNLLSVTDATI
jgi:predicted enzyme related to lactoylglutathione lyase